MVHDGGCIGGAAAFRHNWRSSWTQYSGKWTIILKKSVSEKFHLGGSKKFKLMISQHTINIFGYFYSILFFFSFILINGNIYLHWNVWNRYEHILLHNNNYLLKFYYRQLHCKINMKERFHNRIIFFIECIHESLDYFVVVK